MMLLLVFQFLLKRSLLSRQSSVSLQWDRVFHDIPPIRVHVDTRVRTTPDRANVLENMWGASVLR